MKTKEKLTIVTNSIEILIELSDVSDWNVISVGGYLKEGYLALVGHKAIENISAYNVEKTIVSSKAFDIEKGFSDSTEDFARAKEMMLRCGRECIIAIDSSKFNKFAFSKFSGMNRVDIIVTDKKPSADILEVFANNDVRCLYPED